MKIEFFEFRFMMMERELHLIHQRVENIEEAAIQSIRVLQKCLSENVLPLHIPGHEHDRLLNRFVRQNLTSSVKERKRRNARMSKRMRRKIRRFLHIRADENRDVVHEKPAEAEADAAEECRGQEERQEGCAESAGCA